jgi:hypothetical protein
MGEKRNAYKLLVGKPEGRRSLGRPRRRWGIILKLILEKQAQRIRSGFIWIRIGTSGRLF